MIWIILCYTYTRFEFDAYRKDGTTVAPAEGLNVISEELSVVIDLTTTNPTGNGEEQPVMPTPNTTTEDGVEAKVTCKALPIVPVPATAAAGSGEEPGCDHVGIATQMVVEKTPGPGKERREEST